MGGEFPHRLIIKYKKYMGKVTCEFGKGFIYNLILFAKHQWRGFEYLKNYEEIAKNSENKEMWDEKEAMFMWFYGASDHLYNLEIPKQFAKTEIGKLAKKIQNNGLHFGHGFKEKPTKKDFIEIFNDLEKLAILIDKKLGIKDIEAEFN